ncbi:hypothetical protein EV127DRAFT_433183 [Xylaria flabelliformis]|nr:hypothetical protein EV127DRAFT_433183 [Xylaria flabelliformis]
MGNTLSKMSAISATSVVASTASLHTTEHPPNSKAPSPDQDRTSRSGTSIWSTATVIDTQSDISLTPASSHSQLPDRASTDAVYELESNRPTTTASCRSNRSRRTITVRNAKEQSGVDLSLDRFAIAATTENPCSTRVVEARQAYLGEWMKCNDAKYPGWSTTQCQEQADVDIEWADVVRRLGEGEERRNQVREQRQTARAALPEEPWTFVAEFV